VVGRLLEERMEERGYNQSTLAAASKGRLRQAYISQVIRGEIDLPRDDKLAAFTDLLGITRGEFFRAAGRLEGLPPADVTEAPLPTSTPPPSLFTLVDQLDEVRVIRLDQLVSAGPGEAVPQGIEYRARIRGRKGRTALYSVTAVGTCMIPDIRPGDEVLFDADRLAEPGHTVVAVIDHDEAVVKQLIEREGRRYLSSLDGKHLIPIDERVRVVGVVVLSQHRFL